MLNIWEQSPNQVPCKKDSVVFLFVVDEGNSNVMNSLAKRIISLALLQKFYRVIWATRFIMPLSFQMRHPAILSEDVWFYVETLI